MFETLESRRLMSAAAVGSVTIHSVLTSTPTAVTKVHAGAPHAPAHKKVHHPAPKPKKHAAAKAPKVSSTQPASGTAASGAGATPPVAGNWHATYDDEFNGTSLNPVWHTAEVWDHAVTVVGQGELEAYDASGVSVSDGQLHLTARKDNQYGVPYVSGLVTTGGDQTNPAQSTFSFQYGYMEVRAKIPAGQGLWPAIWMVASNWSDGEIDLMEVLAGDPHSAFSTVHHAALNESQGFAKVGADLSASFHTYGVDWEPDHITFYLDGVATATVTEPSLIPHQPMYPIMNLAVGGAWGGPPNAGTQFPATMDIDYIRVWQAPVA